MPGTPPCSRSPPPAEVSSADDSARFDTLTRAKLLAETLARYEDAKRKNDDKTAVQLLTLLSRLDEKDADENDRVDSGKNLDCPRNVPTRSLPRVA